MGWRKSIQELCREILSPKTSLQFKKMRLIGRIPRFRSIKTMHHSVSIDCPEGSANEISVNSKIPSYEAVNLLEENGFATGFALTEEALMEVRSLCDGAAFSVDDESGSEFYIQPESHEAPAKHSVYRLHNPHVISNVVANIAFDPWLREVAASYLGAPPVLLNTQIWYTFPQAGQAEHHNFGFHYDVDDYRFVKAFFYLTDVTMKTGPHKIISQSHKEESLFKFIRRRISDEEAAVRYSGQIETMIGCAGTGFLEDTLCYHKGEFPDERRLVLQIEYGVNEC